MDSFEAFQEISIVRHQVLAARTQNLQDGPKLLCSADWLYPIEAECLQLGGPIHKSAERTDKHDGLQQQPIKQELLYICVKLGHSFPVLF